MPKAKLKSDLCVSVDTSGLHKTINIARFTNGTLQAKYYAHVQFGCFKKDTHKRVVAQTDRMEYAGQNYDHATLTMNNDCRHLVGVLDKVTGKMRLYGTEFFNMKPVFPDDTPDEPATPSKSFIEKADDLTKAFGSIRNKRAVSGRFVNKVAKDKLDKDMSMAVDDALAQPIINKSISETPTKAGASQVLPPYNLDAKRLEDAYVFSNILTEADVESLSGPAKYFMNHTPEDVQKWVENKMCGTYVIHSLSSLPVSELERRHRCCCLLYAHYIILMLKMKNNHERALPDDIPENIKLKLLESFTVKGDKIRSMPKRVRDKAICYLLVLCLFMEEFCFDLALLLKDLTVSSTKLMAYMYALGCKKSSKLTKSGNTGFVMRLILPLVLPGPNVAKKRR